MAELSDLFLGTFQLRTFSEGPNGMFREEKSPMSEHSAVGVTKKSEAEFFGKFFFSEHSVRTFRESPKIKKFASIEKFRHSFRTPIGLFGVRGGTESSVSNFLCSSADFFLADLKRVRGGPKKVRGGI